MEELRRPSTGNKKKTLHHIRRGCVLLGAAFEEGFGYLKAAVVGLTKKLTAKTEREATDADLMAAKIQVDAADRAEDIKKRFD